MLNFIQWRIEFWRYWNYDPAQMERIEQFEREIIKKFEHYQVPSVCLNSQLSKSGVCKTFILERLKEQGISHKQIERILHSHLIEPEKSQQNGSRLRDGS